VATFAGARRALGALDTLANTTTPREVAA
jgi:hypothetical protein